MTREEAIHRYLPVVKYVAGRIAARVVPHGLEINELINEGVIGLLDALNKYEEDRNVKFETYAITRINGAILDFLRASDWTSRQLRQAKREYERAEDDLTADLGRRPTEAELRERLGWSEAEMSKVMVFGTNRSVISIDEPLVDSSAGQGQNVLIRDAIIDKDLSVEEHVSKTMLLERVREHIADMPESYRRCLEAYYFEQKNLKQIAVVLGISESRASQIHTKAIRELREQLKHYHSERVPASAKPYQPRFYIPQKT